MHFAQCAEQYPLVSIGNCILQTSDRNKALETDMVLSVSNKHGFINQDEQFEDREVASADKSNYKIVQKGDFAYNPARINVGSIARLNDWECGIVSPMYVCFRTQGVLSPAYFEHFFETSVFKYEMHKRLEGSVRLCLTYESLCNIKLNLPPLKVQIEFADELMSMDSKIYNEEKVLILYMMTKQYCLSQMFI